MSEELIRSLNEQLRKANAEAADNRRAKRETKQELAKATQERESLQAQIKALTAERDTLKQQLEAAPSEARKENERLQHELRTRDHKAVFSRLAKEAGIKDDVALEDLWKLSEYQADADTVDEKAVSSVIADAKAKRGYLFSGSGEPTPSPGGTQPVRLFGPGGGRGAPDMTPSTAGKLRVSKADLRNGAWMQTHQAEVAKASAAGLLEIV